MTEFSEISEALDRIVAGQQQQQQRPVADERPAVADTTPEAEFLAQIEAAQQKSGGWVSVPLDQTTDGGRF